ncbi:hypothetical protein GGS20DRAFT_586296 [Poronia punctata]|nr:hypothetical protein GGS20DRAFT_586296 [Poronia punctata]
MRFSLVPIVAILASVSSAVPTAEDNSVGEAKDKRDSQTKGGHCNGTSCRIDFANFECEVGSEMCGSALAQVVVMEPAVPSSITITEAERLTALVKATSPHSQSRQLRWTKFLTTNDIVGM